MRKGLYHVYTPKYSSSWTKFPQSAWCETGYMHMHALSVIDIIILYYIIVVTNGEI